MKYEIIRTDKAEEQLRDIIFYIADHSHNIDIAIEYLDKIETAIHRLQDFPESGSVPKYSILKKQGYRVLIVQSHLIFYKTDHENRIVIIYAVVDGRREYLNML
jgi:toxin ParE1/3/4